MSSLVRGIGTTGADELTRSRCAQGPAQCLPEKAISTPWGRQPFRKDDPAEQPVESGPPAYQGTATSVVDMRLHSGNTRTPSCRDRMKASELLGKIQADFIEVRVAPIVTDPHASVESLVERFNAIVQTIKARRLLNAAPSKQPAAAKS